ncbi:MAG: thiamine pyrophosphate-binding protein, partial [Sulfuritalea sp.]|nr:thiamine pyrophosphate-binding protein [Sulfuritalea sp.]
ADKIAEWLERNAIKHTFGVVGGGSIILWDAIARRGFTELVSCHHEQAAVMAAAYYWRVSGKVAAALVTTGGGSTNALTGVMAAWMDSAAVLVLSGNESSGAQGLTRVLGTQGFDSAKVAEPMTKWANSPTPAGAIISLDRALQVATEPRCGPVWLNFWKDVAGCKI